MSAAEMIEYEAKLPCTSRPVFDQYYLQHAEKHQKQK